MLDWLMKSVHDYDWSESRKVGKRVEHWAVCMIYLAYSLEDLTLMT
jgi:hypothetical protein